MCLPPPFKQHSITNLKPASPPKIVMDGSTTQTFAARGAEISTPLDRSDNVQRIRIIVIDLLPIRIYNHFPFCAW